MQVVSDAAAISSTVLPGLLATMYGALAALQFQGVLLPPACTGDPPFQGEVALMGAALALWFFSAAVFYGFHAPRVRLLGQLSLMWSMVLYPSTVLSVMALLNCSPVIVSPLGATGFDGALVSHMDLGSRTALASMPIYTADPYYVCWSGSHRRPGVLAAIMVPLYVIGLPVLTFYWLWCDPWLRARVRAPILAASAGGDVASASTEQSLNTHTSVSPISKRSQSQPVSQCHDVAAADPLLDVFFYDYKPSAWYTKHLDLCLLFLLSVFRALLPRPTSIVAIVCKAFTISAALLLSCVHVVWARPYLEEDAWMGWVRALLLLDALGIILLNAEAAAIDAQACPVGCETALAAGSYLVLVMCIVTLVVLVVGFAMYAYKGASVEQRAIDNAKIAAERQHKTSVAHVNPMLQRDESLPSPPVATQRVLAPRRVVNLQETVTSLQDCNPDSALLSVKAVHVEIVEARIFHAPVLISSAAASSEALESTPHAVENPLHAAPLQAQVLSPSLSSRARYGAKGSHVKALSQVALSYVAAVNTVTGKPTHTI